MTKGRAITADRIAVVVKLLDDICEHRTMLYDTHQNGLREAISLILDLRDQLSKEAANG